jgi:hypothetical protein
MNIEEQTRIEVLAWLNNRPILSATPPAGWICSPMARSRSLSFFLNPACSTPGCGNLMSVSIRSFPACITQAVAALVAGGPPKGTLWGKLRQRSLGLAAALVWGLALVRGLAAQPMLKSPQGSFEGNAAPVLPSESAFPTSTRTGAFRVGNRTPHPIRLVILMRSGGRLLNPETAHWDFAPGEGGSEGLVLSLGEEPLQIGPGDIVVAFTLDGTARYWGPNVVGESLAPFWNEESGFWSMILQP